jgi:hypothetical protein
MIEVGKSLTTLEGVGRRHGTWGTATLIEKQSTRIGV